MSPQCNNRIAGMSSREGHCPVLMSGGEAFVVRAPRPHGNIARVDYFCDQPARVGVPDLDGAILAPGSQAHTVRAKRHRPDRGFELSKHTEFPPGGCLPDPNPAVLAPRSQLATVRAPPEPPGPPD